MSYANEMFPSTCELILHLSSKINKFPEIYIAQFFVASTMHFLNNI